MFCCLLLQVKVGDKTKMITKRLELIVSLWITFGFLKRLEYSLFFPTIYSLFCFQILISVTELQGMGENWTKTLWTNYNKCLWKQPTFARFYIGILLFTNIVVFIIHLVKNFFFPTTKELIKTTIFPDIYVSTWEEGVGDLTIVLVT